MDSKAAGMLLKSRILGLVRCCASAESSKTGPFLGSEVQAAARILLHQIEVSKRPQHTACGTNEEQTQRIL